MQIDINKLKDSAAFSDEIEWLESLGTLDLKEVVEAGIKAKRGSDLRWGFSRLMTKEQCIEWAVFCAEQVIDIFENKYPEDDRPRKAIEAAKEYLKDPSEENKKAAYAASAASADSAASAAYVASAAYAAALVASYAAFAAYAAYSSYAANAAYASIAASNAAEIELKCIWKGYEILTRDGK